MLTKIYHYILKVSMLIILTYAFLSAINIVQANEPVKIDLVECADRQLAFRMLCNPRWPLERINEQLTMNLVMPTTTEVVSVTIQHFSEEGLSLDDLTPSALSRVFKYAENFTYAKTSLYLGRTIRVEAQMRENRSQYVLDYFLFNKMGQLYRISYSAIGKESYRKYLPLFAKMIRSFTFLNSDDN